MSANHSSLLPNHLPHLGLRFGPPQPLQAFLGPSTPSPSQLAILMSSPTTFKSYTTGHHQAFGNLQALFRHSVHIHPSRQPVDHTGGYMLDIGQNIKMMEQDLAEIPPHLGLKHASAV
jgi:hypothetical protein